MPSIKDTAYQYRKDKAIAHREYILKKRDEDAAKREQLKLEVKEEMQRFSLEEIVYFMRSDIQELKRMLYKFELNKSRAEQEFEQVRSERDCFQSKYYALRERFQEHMDTHRTIIEDWPDAVLEEVDDD